MKSFAIGAALLCAPLTALAQEAPQTDAEWMRVVPEESTIAMPDLAFEEDQSDIDDYEKYYYFHRDDTDFPSALTDLRECDAHSRGLFRGNYGADPSMMALYGVGGVIGGVIGSAISNAIYGSAEERLKRRINMRRCMFFKGYSRYGLNKGVWQEFNFEEGNSNHAEEYRQTRLMMQARVASGPKPEAGELGL